MRFRIKLLLIVSILQIFLQGCSSTGEPKEYEENIRTYFSAKFKDAKYEFCSPIKGYKREGFAYGGDIIWRGWMVEVNISKVGRSGKYQSPKPYLVFFKKNQIVNYVLGSNHKLVTKLK